MKKKPIFLISAGCLAFVAVVVGLCFFFFGTTAVDDVPENVQVQEIDGDFCLVTTYSTENTYSFKIEQQFDEDFVELATVSSSVNTINLSECNIAVVAGQNYRFSACYVNETVFGQYCEPTVWQATGMLSKVDEESINVKDNVLSWDAVFNADGYTLKVIDESGSVSTYNLTSAMFLLSRLSVGRYQVFVMATSTNSAVESSAFSEGIYVEYSQTNKITAATRADDNTLTVVCSGQPAAFVVYVDGTLKGQLEVSEFYLQSGGYAYILDANVLLFDVDDDAKIEVGSLANGYLYASELFEVT